MLVKIFSRILDRGSGLMRPVMCPKSQIVNPEPARCIIPRAALLGVLLALFAAATASAQDVERGRQVFQLCAACHGVSGEGSQRYHAPAIGGLDRWYVEAQLVKFRQGARGFRPEDAEGLQMRPMARALVGDHDVRAVAAYVAGLKPAVPPATLGGDARRGQAAYAACAACHGDRAQGNPGVGAPPLARQADWYLASQLRKFRQGLRGTHPSDATGAQMRPMAMTLTDERAVADVLAYIRSLGR
jgi:cytochrome c oxidase subunit 2